MRFALATLFFLLLCFCVKGQDIGTKWYSEHENNGVVIQNSFPKGGHYPGPISEHFNYSYLVFYTRVMNETGGLIELNVEFSADSISIPNSPNTFMKVFLPPDTMTLDKRQQFSYGVTRIESFGQSTSFQGTLNPKEDCLFYAVAVFYQIKNNVLNEDRGGNRAEFTFNGKELLFHMRPQIDALPCGYILFKK